MRAQALDPSCLSCDVSFTLLYLFALLQGRILDTLQRTHALGEPLREDSGDAGGAAHSGGAAAAGPAQAWAAADSPHARGARGGAADEAAAGRLGEGWAGGAAGGGAAAAAAGGAMSPRSRPSSAPNRRCRPLSAGLRAGKAGCAGRGGRMSGLCCQGRGEHGDAAGTGPPLRPCRQTWLRRSRGGTEWPLPLSPLSHALHPHCHAWHSRPSLLAPPWLGSAGKPDPEALRVAPGLAQSLRSGGLVFDPANHPQVCRVQARFLKEVCRCAGFRPAA
jgi:hypothetical protein